MQTPRAIVIAAALGAAVPASAAAGPGSAANARAAWAARFHEARQGPEQTEQVSRTFAVGAGALLDLTNVAGDVRITGGGGGEIRIDAVKRVRSRDERESRRLLDAVRIEMGATGPRVEVRTHFPRGGGQASVAVDYTITVPQGAAVTARTISGDVIVGRVDGEVRLETVSGDLDMSTLGNLAQAKTISGDVTVHDATAATLLALGTVSGSVLATKLSGRALEAGSVSGTVRIREVRMERVQAKSVSGPIEFTGPFVRGGHYQFNAHSGDIRVALPEGTGFEVTADTFSGRVQSEFDLTLRGDGDRGGRGGQREARTLRGTHGDGGAVLEVRSFSGNVTIARLAAGRK